MLTVKANFDKKQTMLNHLKFVSKVPWIARCTWLAIMLLASQFASHWGVVDEQINRLLIVSGAYVVVVAIGFWLRYPDLQGKLFVGFLFDLMMWSVFIFYSGGASNPLITLFLTIVAVASIVLATRYIIWLSVLSVASYTLLWYFYQSLSMHHQHHMAQATQTSEQLHLLGMFGVFICALLMLTALTVYFKAAMNRSYQILEQAQQAIHRQRRLLAVSSLAANIAHEMSTPIASMQLLTDDIASQLDEDDELLEDVNLLQSQIQVCRHSLDTLKKQIQVNDANNVTISAISQSTVSQLATLIPKLVGDWRFLHPHIQVALPVFDRAIDAHINSEQLYAILTNILNNAMQA